MMLNNTNENNSPPYINNHVVTIPTRRVYKEKNK